MNRRFSILLALVVAVAIASPSRADDGWSLANLNPFKKKESKLERTQRAHASFSDSDEKPERGFFPTMSFPKWGSRTHTPKPTEPSTLAKLNEGTKDLFGKTKEVLMPWSSSPKKKSRSTKKSSFSLTSWLTKKEEPKRPRTVKDFIGQPRPGF